MYEYFIITNVKPFQTDRLIIREFRHDDLGEIYRILDVELKYKSASGEVSSISERKQWLDWTIKGYEQNKLISNPPFGSNAVVLKENMQLIGACGFVPVMAPLGLIPYYRYISDAKDTGLNYSEVGMFLAISPHYQCRGFAYEAASSLIRIAFSNLKLNKILAVSSPHNNPSIAVMKRLGMKIETLSHDKLDLVIGLMENNNGVQ